MIKQKDEYLQELSRKEIMEMSKQQFFNEKTLDIVTADNGIIVPPYTLEKKKVFILFTNEIDVKTPWYYGGVLDSYGNYIDMSSQPAFGMRNRIMGPCEIDQSTLDISNETVIYMNAFIHQWGHFLIDVIGRLWYAIFNDTKTKIAYTCVNENEDCITGTFLELLQLMGIDEDRLILVKRPTRFKRVIVAETAIYPGLYFTREYRDIFDVVISNSNVCMERGKKIYCSRRMLGKGNEEGEEKIEKVFNQNGYQSVFLEKMTLVEQIKTLNSAEKIAMVNGSLAHNLLFVRNEAETFIINKTYLLNLHQFLINEVTNASAVFVDAYCSPLPVIYGAGPFILIKSRPFLMFCEEQNIKCEDVQSNIPLLMLIKYYIRWAWQYKGYLVRGEKIWNSPDGKFDRSLCDVLAYFNNRGGC